MATFGDMKTRIADDFVNESVTTAQIGAAILSAIASYERRRFYFNEAHGSFSTVSGQEYYTTVDLADIPNMVEVQTARYGSSPLRKTSSNSIDDEQDGSMTGTPTHYAYVSQSLRLFPIPDVVGTIKLAYIKRFPALAADGDSNVWTTDAEELIRQAAKRRLSLDILHADDMAARCSALENEAFDDLERETRLRRTVGNMRTPELATLSNINATFNVMTG